MQAYSQLRVYSSAVFLSLQEEVLSSRSYARNFVSFLSHKIVNDSGGHKMMSKLRRTCAVAIVTAVLAVPAFAGIIDSPGAPAPAPTPSQTSSASTSMTTVILTILSLIR